MTHTTKTTPTHFTLPAILPAMITGLFILTACGGSALTNDAPIATNTQKNVCEANPLADGCQADAGFLSVNDNANQEDAVSVAPVVNAPPTPEPVVKKIPAPKPQETPVVKKTEPVLKKLAKKKTQPAPAPAPTPEPITSVDTSDFVPKTSYSTYSSPASDGPTGQQSPAPVTAAATTAFTDLPTEREVATRNELSGILNLNNLSNQFLEADDDTGLDRLGAVRADPLRMNLADARYDGVAIGGDAADGIDFFTVNNAVVTKDGDNQVTGITNSRYHYAGILSGTDLGAPVSSDVTSATWNGSFRTYNTNPVDFELTVGFGTTEQDRTISAFVKDTAWSLVDNYYFLEGTYGTNGLITATVNWGEFTGRNSATPKDGRLKNGTLTGLIGAQGAVGVFISDNGKNAETSDGYAGGFVASATFTGNPDVTFSDWTRAIPTVTGGNNGFEAGGATGLAQTAITNVINLADCEAHNAQTVIDTITYTYNRPDTSLPISATNQVTHVTSVVTRKPKFDQLDCTGNHGGSLKLAGTKFGEVTDSGVAFVTEGISLTTLTSGKSFAGLLSGTDLGAPITSADQVGEWKGQFKSLGAYYFGASPSDGTRVETALDLDFTLTVTFGGGTGTLSAFVPIDNDGRHFYLTGTFDANGVITGDVRAANFKSGQVITKPATTVAVNGNGNGVLTGLIGVEGAVGAFISNADNYNYAGGFVANAIPPDTEREVTFGDWTRSFATAPATAPTTGTPQSEFLQTTGSTLPTGTLTAVGGGAITVTTLDLKTASFSNNQLGGDANDGVAFYQGYVNTDVAGYAGIFDTTDLGAPISAQDARALWAGQFQVLGDNAVNTDFTLEVTFGGEANATGSIEAFVLESASDYYYLNGTFSNMGVIKGTTTFGTFTDGDRNAPSGVAVDGVLTGLIGEDGAVGAFYSNTGVYAGGFVARPTVFVTYDTWLNSFGGPLLSAGDFDSIPVNQFLQGGEMQVSEGNVRGPGNTPVNVRTLTLEDDTDSGVSFFRGARGPRGNLSFRTVFFAGILSGTEVGLPLAPYTSGDTATAEWDGYIQWTGWLNGISLFGADAAKKAFKLEVNFQDSEIEAFVNIDDLNHHLLLKAGYNELGQFTNGTITYGTFAGADRDATPGDGAAHSNGTQFDQAFSGKLTGIIGQDGAVGAFISDAVTPSSKDYGFAGGFVASPTE